MTAPAAPSKEELLAHHCWEPRTDRVSGAPDVSAFRQRARLHQALWREARGYPIGSHPMAPKQGASSKPLGSRLDLAFAIESGANFVSEDALEAVRWRLAHPEKYQTLNPQRLWGDLLSSMPMCANVFGPLWADRELANDAVAAWFPEAEGPVHEVRLEWSPGRCDPAFLDNRTAFDAAIEVRRSDGSLGIVGIETKYHEHAVAEKSPSEARMRVYRRVHEASGLFVAGAIDAIVGTDLQQVWLDHLLVLTMLQHPSKRWTWGEYVLVHPGGNPGFGLLAERYRELLLDDRTLRVVTLEELLDEGGPLPAELGAALRERYLVA